MPSGSLLVARIRSRLHSPSTRWANAAADSITCSQLSRISSASRSRTAAMSRSVSSASGTPPSSASRRPSAASAGCATSASAPMAASSTSQAPSGRPPSSVRPVSVASLVFPDPPGPIRVVSRCPAMSSRTAATSASLPTKLVSSARKLVFRFSLSPAKLAPQQRDVQCRQLRRGVGAKRVGQRLPRALEHHQRLAAAAGRDEGAHQRGDKPFPYRVRGHQVGQFRDQLRAAAEAGLRVEPVLHGGQAQSLEPGDRRVKRRAVLQADALHGRAAPQREGLAQQRYPPRSLVSAGLAHEALEPHRVDGAGFQRQPVAVRLPLDQPFRQRLAQPGDQALQGIRRVRRRALAPDPVDEGRLRDRVTRLEREGDQQRAQPGARHVGEDAVVRANLK